MVEQLVEPPSLPGLTYVRPLGQGGYAEVFLYEQVSPRMRVAVKVLFGEGLSERARERFADEANAMAQLADHPNIVQVFRTDVTDDGRPYLVMKYYPQRNLAVRAAMERIAVPEVIQIGIRVACAVETAHRAGILHRDIKPANILTSQYGEPGLADFGIATTGADGDGDAEGLSLPWSPPEVVFSTSPSSRAADVYSLGATLWHLLVGHSPFEEPAGENSTAALMSRIRETAPPSTSRPDVPPSLDRLLAQAMAKTPLDRPKSALQLARGLQAVELEQRWPTTPLVLLEGGTETSLREAATGPDPSTDADPTSRGRPRRQSTLAPDAGEDPPTRRRPARPPGDGDDADPGRRRPPAGAGAGKAGGGRVREGLPPPTAEPGTVLRPRVATPEAAAPEEAAVAPGGRPDGSSRRRRVLLGVAALVAVLGAAVGVALAASGGGGRARQGSGLSSAHTSTAPTIFSGAPTAAPTQPVGTRTSPSQVHFTWTVPDEQPGEVVGWATTAQPTQITTVTSNAATVDSATPVCIVVYVKNSSGQQASRSTPGCGG